MAVAMDTADYFTDEKAASLAHAAAKGDTVTVAKLLAEGVDVNVHGRDGITPIIWTLLKENKEGFEYLLQHGADPNFQLPDGTSDLAKQLPFAGNSAVSFAARNADIWYLDTVLKYGGNANLVNPFSGVTPIFESIQSQRTLQPQKLILSGANLNFQDKDGVTPLIYAVMCNRFDLAYDMLVAGADPTIKNKWGNTVIYFIVKSVGHTLPEMSHWRERVVDLLRKRGVNVATGP
jgi:ankyrin repeat protein